jgi:acyl carrier protein
MNQAEVIEQLQKIFNTVFLEPVPLSRTLDIRKLRQWDWIADIYFVIAVEDFFGVRFQVYEVETTKNIGEFADLILKRLNAPPI